MCSHAQLRKNFFSPAALVGYLRKVLARCPLLKTPTAQYTYTRPRKRFHVARLRRRKTNRNTHIGPTTGPIAADREPLRSSWAAREDYALPTIQRKTSFTLDPVSEKILDRFRDELGLGPSAAVRVALRVARSALGPKLTRRQVEIEAREESARALR